MDGDLELGVDRLTGESVYLTAAERLEHMAVFGSTGTGKTSAAIGWLRQLAIRHDQSGQGFLVIDRPGTMVDALVAWMAAYDIEAPTLIIDPSDHRWVVPYSPLVARPGKDHQTVARDAVRALMHSRGREDASDAPLMEDTAAMTFDTILAAELTIADALDLLDPDDNIVRDAAIARLPAGGRLARYWAEFESKARSRRVTDTASTRRRLTQLCGSPTLRSIMGRPASIDLSRAMDDGLIVLLSLSTAGAGGAADTTVLATMLLSDLWTRATERRPGARPFTVCIDEASTLVTPSVAAALPQARKHGVGFMLVTQAPAQFKQRDPRLFTEVMLNARTKVCFQLDVAGAKVVAPELGVSAEALLKLDRQEAIVRLPRCPRPRFIRIETLVPMEADRQHRRAWVDGQMGRFEGLATRVHDASSHGDSMPPPDTGPEVAVQLPQAEPAVFSRIVGKRRPASPP